MVNSRILDKLGQDFDVYFQSWKEILLHSYCWVCYCDYYFSAIIAFSEVLFRILLASSHFDIAFCAFSLCNSIFLGATMYTLLVSGTLL